MLEVCERDIISVIIPAYNCENTIGKCVDSLKEQSIGMDMFEVIIVDDGSSDNTKSILDDITKDFSNFRIISKNNGGVSSARNLGIKLAKGKYICFVDADDFVSPDYLKELVEHTNDESLLMCGICILSKYTKKKIVPKNIQHFNFKNKFHFFMYIYKKHLFEFIFNKIYIRDRIGYFNENVHLGEDILFNLDYLKKVQTVSFINLPLYYYVANFNSATHVFRSKEGIEQAYLMCELYYFCITFFDKIKIKMIRKEASRVLKHSFLSPFEHHLSKDKIISIYDEWLSSKEIKECNKLFLLFDSSKNSAFVYKKYKLKYLFSKLNPVLAIKKVLKLLLDATKLLAIKR